MITHLHRAWEEVWKYRLRIYLLLSICLCSLFITGIFGVNIHTVIAALDMVLKEHVKKPTSLEYVHIYVNDKQSFHKVTSALAKTY